MSWSHSAPLRFERSFPISRVDRDASGLTMHRDTGHLWVVIDEPEHLVELTDEGVFVREVKLKGFKDTEGLCHLSGDRFAVAEERKMRISLIDIPRGVTEVDDPYSRINLEEEAKKNKGLEGISYDRETDTIFAVREDKPRTVFRIHHVISDKPWQVDQWPLDLRGLDDLSDLYFDDSTGWLWLLSHESRRAVAFDSKGYRAAEWNLRRGERGLPEDIRQAEGMTRDRQGRWLICSEPNRIYRFE